MKTISRTLFAASALALAAHASAQVTIHERENFQGRSYTSQQRVGNLQKSGLNDRASSVVVTGRRWEACEDVNLRGRCMVLRPGQYPSLTAMGLNDRISSVRPLPANERVADNHYAPLPIVANDYRRRRDERLYDAEVTSVRAVAGTPSQRCWMEREQVAQQQPQQEQQQAALSIPGAAVGAVIGGILGHQVGGGSGQKIATVGGVVGGAALGSQYGRWTQPAQQAQAAPLTQDVRRCDTNAAQAAPAYWDVTYKHEGKEHRVQMATPPGQTIIVNRRGEPRV